MISENFVFDFELLAMHMACFRTIKLLLLGVNIPVTSLHRIENNQRTVRDYEICALSIALDVSFDELLLPVKNVMLNKN